jgi:competence protein ComEC
MLPPVDVVTVPHHGSRTSSTGSFIAALSPSIAIVSAGHGNRWGFPKDDVVGRWRRAGADVLQTAASGAIAVRACKHAGIVSIVQNREQHRRIWHAVATDATKKGD